MGNFRRKKIIETIKNAHQGKISHEESKEILKPYEVYIERLLDECQEFQDIDSKIEIETKKNDYYLDQKRICDEISEHQDEKSS
jgi:hypothetical protein